LIEEGERLWNHIKVGDIEFEEKIVAAESLTTITKEQLIEFY
jgi:secreted Zn-dependent insulinase-like peptidase